MHVVVVEVVRRSWWESTREHPARDRSCHALMRPSWPPKVFCQLACCCAWTAALLAAACDPLERLLHDGQHVLLLGADAWLGRDLLDGCQARVIRQERIVVRLGLGEGLAAGTLVAGSRADVM